MLFAGWILIAIPFIVVGVKDSSHKSHKYKFDVNTYDIDTNYYLYNGRFDDLKDELHTKARLDNMLQKV